MKFRNGQHAKRIVLPCRRVTPVANRKAFILTGSGIFVYWIQVYSPWMMPATQGDNAVVYFKLFNHTSEGDLLSSVSTDAAEAAQLDGRTSEVNFGSGVLRVMLLGLKQHLHLRDEIEVTLHFLHSPDLVVNVPVRSFPPPSESGEHH